MNPYRNTVKMVGMGLAAALIVTGCATAKKPGQAATPAPAVGAAPAAAMKPKAAMAGDVYAVVKGDCLWCISSKSEIYGSPFKWPLIFKANAGQIRDADLIYPGQELTIERNSSAAAIDAAIQHAKTRGAWALGPVEESDRAYLGAR